MPATNQWHLIHNLARALKRRFEEKGRQFGLTLPQWRVLNQLGKTDEVSQVALANLVDMDPMTVSGIVDRLETKGLVERIADPRDSRAKLVKSTPAAQALATEIRGLVFEVYEEALEGVSEHERDVFFSIIARMEANLCKQRHPIQEFGK